MNNIKVGKTKIPSLKWFFADDAAGNNLIIGVALMILLEDGTEEELLFRDFQPPLPRCDLHKITLNSLFPYTNEVRNTFPAENKRLESAWFDEGKNDKPVLRILKPGG